MRSRTRRIIDCAAAAVLVMGASAATSRAQVLFTTAADWGGGALSNDATQTGYLGWGTRGPDYPFTPSTGFGAPEDLTFTGPDLDGSTVNGIGNYNNDNDNMANGVADPNFNFNAPTYYGGKSSPGGSMTIPQYQGGYDTVTTGEMLEGGTTTGNTVFVDALTQNGSNKGVLKIDFTTPIPVGAVGSTGTTAGTVLDPSTYFLIGFLMYDNNAAYASGWINPANGSATNPDAGRFGDAPGSYAINNGSSFTGYLPYNLTGTFTTNPLQYLQFGIILNTDGAGAYAGVGDVTIDDIEAMPLTQTYAIRRAVVSGSWGQNVAWGDGINVAGHAVATPQNAGDEASFVFATANPVTITLDGDRTVGNLNFFNDTSTYTLAPGSGGSLVFNNLSASANLTNQAGNNSITAPVVLATDVTVNFFNATDTLSISGNISGPGGIIKNGLGTLALSGTNTYTGPTSINSGAYLLNSKKALPSGTNLTIGGTAHFALPSGFGRVTLSGLTVNTGATFDIANNGLQINFGAGTDPGPAIATALAAGYNSGLWTGTGITSSVAALNPSKFAVGYIDGNVASDTTAHTVGPNQVVVRYTLAGDAFLEGSVGFDDLVVVAQNFGFTGKDWAGGNFNYDPTGSVGFPDLVSVAQNFGFSSGVSNGDTGGGLSPAWQVVAATSVVPEPASMGLMILAAAGLTARRKRR